MRLEQPVQRDLDAWVTRTPSDDVNLGVAGIDGWFNLRLKGVDKNGYKDNGGSFFPNIGDQLGFNPSEGTILALLGMCGSGKSMTLREFMHRWLKACRISGQTLPKILLITANITYGDNLHAELLRCADEKTAQPTGFQPCDIGYYRSKDNDHGSTYWDKPTVLCSLESLHAVPPASTFDLILLDEVRTIAHAAVGTMMDKHANNPHLLAHFCKSAKHIIVSDADLTFTSSASEEPRGAVHAFLKFLAPTRKVVRAWVGADRPPHLRRFARLYYTGNKTKIGTPVDEGWLGRAEWEERLRGAINAAKGDKDKRVVVLMATKKVDFRQVCHLFK